MRVVFGWLASLFPERRFSMGAWLVSVFRPQRPPGRASADSGDDRGGNGNGAGTAIITRTRTVPKKPSMYRVLLLNDDYTPMEFVVMVLRRYFNKNQDAAWQIMMHVHRNGVGECGIYTFEVAETKVTQVIDYARRHEHPLQCTLEKE